MQLHDISYIYAGVGSFTCLHAHVDYKDLSPCATL